jgi:hypothetical protein
MEDVVDVTAILFESLTIPLLLVLWDTLLDTFLCSTDTICLFQIKSDFRSILFCCLFDKCITIA